MAKKKARARRPRSRKPGRARAARRRRTRLIGGLAVLGAAALFVPSVRAGAVHAADVITSIIDESRAADARRERVVGYAEQYAISLDLARDIERAAVAEGVDPDLAFRLVRVESSFRERAVSPAGALGLTQLMPATAEWLQPGITREQIFERETNLRLGFRYLRRLIRAYDGRVDEALHAYNRGPGTVQRIRAAGGDPANGYAGRVMGVDHGRLYEGSGLLRSPRTIFP